MSVPTEFIVAAEAMGGDFLCISAKVDGTWVRWTDVEAGWLRASWTIDCETDEEFDGIVEAIEDHLGHSITGDRAA